METEKLPIIHTLYVHARSVYDHISHLVVHSVLNSFLTINFFDVLVCY